MTPKELLLNDLEGRIQYGVYCKTPNGTGCIAQLKGIIGDTCYFNDNPYHGDSWKIENIKPYLRSMSSMTEEEEEYVLNTWGIEKFCNGIDLLWDNYLSFGDAHKFIDWLNANHFNYRLPHHLFIEVTEENNPYKKILPDSLSEAVKEHGLDIIPPVESSTKWYKNLKI